MPSLDRPWTFTETAAEYDRIKAARGRAAANEYLAEVNRGHLVEKQAHIAHDEYTAKKKRNR